MDRRSTPRRLAVALALLFATGQGVLACSDAGGSSGAEGKRGGGKGKGGRGRGGPPRDAMQANVVHLREATIERWYRSSGTLEALRSAELVAVQPAIIEALFADEGDFVRKGQKLARLDGRELSLQADAGKLALANLEAELRRLESADAAVISREEIDKQRYLVEEARASLKLSRHQAKQTTIRAPFDGTIVTRYVDEGNLASTATALFHLADLAVLELPLHLPEKDAASVEVGSDVEVELVDGTIFQAKIERRSPVVDPMTGTVKFTMRASDPPKVAAPGAFARAKVLVDSRASAPSLPRSAIFEHQGKPHVYVIAEEKAQRREIEVGLEGADRVEVLAGVSVDDAIVVEGNSGITEGMPLRPIEPEVAAAEPSAEKQAKDSAGS
ncbi:MAG: efflux RND transporter periplasmic adaptor subunit [Myxococcota bacterium]